MYNEQGDVVGLTDLSGKVVVEYTYDAWGNPLSITGTLASTIGQLNPFRYRGYVWDSETGLFYVNSRYYNPETSRYICADNQLNPDAFGSNQFAYCSNNPVSRIDAGGNDWNDFVKGVKDGFVGYYVGLYESTVGFFNDPIGTIVADATRPRDVYDILDIVGPGAGTGINLGSTLRQNVNSTEAFIAGDHYTVGTIAGNNLGDVSFQAATTAIAIGAAKGVSKIASKLNFCFVAGTLVAVENGYVPIKKISPGDLVWAENPETGEKGLKTVVQTFINETRELVHVYAGGEEIIVTPEHPFYVPKKGWTGAIELEAGDILVLLNGKYVAVEKIQHEILETPIKVYNFEVENFHTYYVGENSILVHNTCIIKQNGVKIESYYPNDHAPAHLHVYGKGKPTKIGINGKSLKGLPALSAQQSKVVSSNLSTIQKALAAVNKALGSR